MVGYIKTLLNSFGKSHSKSALAEDVVSPSENDAAIKKQTLAVLAEFEDTQASTVEWILSRKVEAGAIAAQELEHLDKLIHVCDIVNQVIDDIAKMTVQLADTTKVPKIAEMIEARHGEKQNNIILRQLKNADAVTKTAALHVLQVKDKVLDAKIKMHSTGWLSDRPPITKNTSIPAEVELKQKKDVVPEVKKVEVAIADVEVPTPHVEEQPEQAVTPADSVSQPQTQEEAQQLLNTLRNKRKRWKKAMKKRAANTQVSEEERAATLRNDTTTLEELNSQIQDLVNLSKILPSSEANPQAEESKPVVENPQETKKQPSRKPIRQRETLRKSRFHDAAIGDLLKARNL